MANAKSTQQDNDWFGSQQKYWDTWFEAQRKAFGEQWQAPSSAASGFQAPWADFFKEWQNVVSSGQQGKDTDAFQQYFVKTGATFMDMMEKFYQATGQAKPLDQMAQEWVDQLQTYYANILKTASQPFDVSEGHQSFAHSMNKASQVWASLLQPGDGIGKYDAKKGPFFSFDPLHAYTLMPGLGYTREKQEDLNKLYKCWIEYRRKASAYDAGMATVGMEAVKKFQECLAKPPQGHEPITSLKGVYTKWVDCCEEIYAKYAMSEEYTKLYGESVNALMAFKKQQNKMTDDLMEQLNMPTRQEIDSLHERFHTLRRDNIQLKKDIAELKAVKKPKAPVSAKKAAKPKMKKGKKK
ncbi:MAG: class III poly(R)-hydroxyalkanoic acid synthase subunit PhaE [Alphaproteobacteria bacterium]|nr:class III poly(R)-hydroxyalkanoic acid synthase subunit PhaE [Alphaproteobacteria bacterium]